ncbi:hypothetical protein M569_05589, partial [Genlisea aurea]
EKLIADDRSQQKQDADGVENPAASNEEKESEICDSTKLEKAIPPPLDLERVSQEIEVYISALNDCRKDGGESSSAAGPDVPIVVEQYAMLVEAKIGEYDSVDSPVKWSDLTAEETASFIQAICCLSSLSKGLSDFASDFKFAYSINRIGGVLQRAMSYLEEEFKILLEDCRMRDSDSGNETKSEQNTPASESVPVAAENSFSGNSDQIFSELARLSDAMIVGGYEEECSLAYFVARRHTLEESLKKIGFEKYSIDEVQKMQWDTLEREIVTWITTFKEFTGVQFPMEKNLSETVFSGRPSTAETLFSSLCSGVMIQLLNFASAVALTKRAAEKLFKFLDIYEALRDVLPENSFPEDWRIQMKTEASIINARIGEALILIFIELENSIKADSGKTPVPGGAIHPLTRYTMNYLKYACEYRDTLNQVFKEHHHQNQIEEEEEEGDLSETTTNHHQPPPPSPFHDQLVRAMDLLDANLEAKAKLYRELSLRAIFMMNNGRYILQKARGSVEISGLMGDPWIRKRSSDLRQFHKTYTRETWSGLLNCLHPEGLNSHGKVVKPVLKERFKSFNAMFDEIHRTQAGWVVSDDQLQSELRVSISNMVIPAYRSFLGRYGQVFTPGRQTEKYVKYQADDIETCIDELFDGTAAASQGKKKL